MSNNFNDAPVPDISAHAIFESVQRARDLACQQRIAEINKAFDQVLMQQGGEREVTRTAELLRSLQQSSYYRASALASIDPGKINIKERTVELTFASEYAVFNRTLNALEVLEMSANAANLKRLNAGGPLLWQHKRDDQIGVVLKAWIGADKRAYAVVKFSSSRRGREFFKDVVDGIRRNVSFNYRIIKPKVIAGARGKPDTVIATLWEALEISLVSVPADPTVGVGRSEVRR